MTRRFAVAAMMVLVLAAVAIWQPHDPEWLDPARAFEEPSSAHWLGLDHLGRCLLSRIMMGAGPTLQVLAGVAGATLAFGVPAGLALGLLPDRFGWPLQRACELLAAVPSLLLALIVVGLFGLSTATVALALGLAQAGPFALLLQALSRRISVSEYVLAARGLMLPWPRIALRHVLPNVAPTLSAAVAADLGRNVLHYAALAFLGIGGSVSGVDWGGMIQDYRLHLQTAPVLVVVPVLAIGLVGGGLSLLLDPTEDASVD